MAEPDLQIQLQAELDPEFQILRLLGEGSVAQVYLARERALQRLVAIKFMKSQFAQDDTARKRFEREARSAAKIHHQNVATVHRVGSLEDQTPFIIMEYIEGRNLADALQAEGVMTIEEVRHTLSQVASALAAAHEKGIVHRDVKPDNVVRERDSDRVVLTDFGIAGILETGTETITSLTQQGQLLGDPRYMSPEQLLGEALTDASDVYSLGVMGYELLTLQALYEGKTSVQMVTAHLKKEPIPLARLRPDADPALADLLERCLSKNPRHRPRASEVAKALERVTAVSFQESSTPASGVRGRQGVGAGYRRVPRRGPTQGGGLLRRPHDSGPGPTRFCVRGLHSGATAAACVQRGVSLRVGRLPSSGKCSGNNSISPDPRGCRYPDGHPGGPHASELSGDSRPFVDVRYQREGNSSNRVGCLGGRSGRASSPEGFGVRSQPRGGRAGRLVALALGESPTHL